METEDVFFEEYDEGNCSSSEEETFVEESATLPEQEEVKLGISSALAKANYNAAGFEVEEDPEQITVAKYSELINAKVDSLLDDVVNECQMEYQPSEMQRVSVNAVGTLKNVVLVSPTGSGKMNVPLLATLVLRKALNKPKGVCIVTQPLSCIMKQKMENDVCKIAILSMAGEFVTESSEDDGSLTCQVNDLLDGSIPALFCHPESLSTKLGQFILRELKRREMLILICIDEVHQGGKGHWDVFRPSMMSNSASLRLA